MPLRRTHAALCLLLLIALGAAAATARAQASALYFPATGHHLTDEHGFLSFWQARGGERLLGFPVTEAQLVEGLPVQYFERGRLEQIDDPDSGERRVQTGRVGTEYAEALWKQFPAAKPSAGARVFEATGRTLREPFLSFWEASGGLEFFGAPISEALWEHSERGQVRVQYFERARLERNDSLAGTPDEILVSRLGRALALMRGYSVEPVANWGAAVAGPPAPQNPNVVSLDVPPTPTPAPPTATPKPAAKPPTQPAKAPTKAPAKAPAASSAGKLVVVNLSHQWLYAYKDGELVFDAPVSTGRDGMNTPAGSFSVYSKTKLQTMRGSQGGEPWVVPDVPNVMYINGDVAIHGTYWHNKFGTGARLSHGCINLPLRSAAWLYDWAPVGTAVKVVY